MYTIGIDMEVAMKSRILTRLNAAYGQNALLCKRAGTEIIKLRKEIERLKEELKKEKPSE